MSGGIMHDPRCPNHTCIPKPPLCACADLRRQDEDEKGRQ